MDPTSVDMGDIVTPAPRHQPHLRCEANLPGGGRSPGFAMWGKSRLRGSIPGWAGSESLYMGVVRVPGGLGQCPDRRIVAGGAGGRSTGPP